MAFIKRFFPLFVHFVIFHFFQDFVSYAFTIVSFVGDMVKRKFEVLEDRDCNDEDEVANLPPPTKPSENCEPHSVGNGVLSEVRIDHCS